MEDIVVQIH